MRVALLRGREHEVLGAVDTVAEGRVALAISRGGAAKTYAHVHPNEDAALCVEGSRGILVAVADGHWGAEAGEAALEALATGPARDWCEGETRPRGLLEDALRGGVEVAEKAVLALHRVEGGRSPRTTLALALVRPEEDLLAVASVGDSHVFRATAEDVIDLADAPGRVGYLGSRGRDGRTGDVPLHVTSAPLRGALAVVAATDGLSEFGIGVEDPERAVAEAVQQARSAPPPLRARELARHLVETALAAQREQAAGDNVAAAVAWLGDAELREGCG